MEPTEHFGIYFGYIRRLFQSWVSPFKKHVRHIREHIRTLLISKTVVLVHVDCTDTTWQICINSIYQALKLIYSSPVERVRCAHLPIQWRLPQSKQLLNYTESTQREGIGFRSTSCFSASRPLIFLWSFSSASASILSIRSWASLVILSISSRCICRSFSISSLTASRSFSVSFLAVSFPCSSVSRLGFLLRRVLFYLQIPPNTMHRTRP